jgi:hypothetical protein
VAGQEVGKRHVRGTCQPMTSSKALSQNRSSYKTNLFGVIYIVRCNFEISAIHTLREELRICLEGNALSELRSHNILLSPTIHKRSSLSLEGLLLLSILPFV